MRKKSFKKDLTILLEYLWPDEKRHYMEGPSKKHIYVVMRRLGREIDYKWGEK